MRIKVQTWKPSPTSKAGLGFYPPRKFIGQVLDDDGKVLAETGKCETNFAAYEGATRLRADLKRLNREFE